MGIQGRLSQLNSLRLRAFAREQRPDAPWPRAPQPLEELVAGQVLETEVGTCYLATRTMPLHEAHGPLPVGALLERSPAALAAFTPSSSLDDALAFQQAAFIDTETTGLGGAASVYAFMVGVGSFEPLADAGGAPELHYVVRQIFMRSPAEEPALLDTLARLLRDKNLAVTFNGRAFDLPLLRSRYAFNRRHLPNDARHIALLAPTAPHLDLLQPARQMWRRRLQSCRLLNLEAQILGLARSEEDVPGSLIPQMYVDYVRSGDAAEMRKVFYHNRQDILSTTALATQLCQAVEMTAHEGARRHGADWYSLGAAQERAGRWADAGESFRRALAALDDNRLRAEVFAHLGRVLKRQGRWREAVGVWELWVTTIPGADASPYIELAKCYEWEARDLEQAEMWAAWGLHTVRTAPQSQRIPGQAADLETRLARIQRRRKAAGQPGASNQPASD